MIQELALLIYTENRENGLKSATFYKWRSKYGGMDASLLKRINEFEEVNNLLKKMQAEKKLKSEINKKAMQKSGKAIFTHRDSSTSLSAIFDKHKRYMQYIFYQ
jgi:hypothetical protein